jgi:hypothetical protein
MHPLFVWIGRLHFGQGLEFGRTQFIFSDAALFFSIHLETVSQFTRR